MQLNSRAAFAGGVLLLALLILTACGTQPNTPTTSPMLLPAQTDVPCLSCAEATLAALQTQEKIGADAQAAATAEIMLPLEPYVHDSLVGVCIPDAVHFGKVESILSRSQ